MRKPRETQQGCWGHTLDITFLEIVEIVVKLLAVGLHEPLPVQHLV